MEKLQRIYMDLGLSSALCISVASIKASDLRVPFRFEE